MLNAKEKENKVLVLAAAARKDMISQRLELLKGLGLEADFVTLNSLAIANLYSLFHKPGNTHPAGHKHSAVAVLDVGERISNLTVLVNGEPRFTRDIFLGGSEMTSAISNSLSIDYQTAEEMKCASPEMAEDVLKACESLVMNLVGEVRLSFDYFLTEKNIPVEEVLLTGGGSLGGGFPEMFGKYLEVPTRRWDPVSGMKIDERLNAGEVKEQANRLTVALGLALANQ